MRVVVLFVLMLAACRPAPRPDLQTAIWYWNSRLEFNEADLTLLRRMSIQQIYIRAGQFGVRAGSPVLIRSVQQWKRPGELSVHLVYNFTPEMIKAFSQIDPEVAAREIGEAIAGQVAEASAVLQVSGIQLDFDVPTRSLEHYRQFLRALRGQFPAQIFSITTLGDWIERREYAGLVAEVDFHVPQLYGFQVPRRYDRVNSISDPATIRAYLNRLANSPKPYWVGLHTYGYYLIYNEKGELVSLRTDLDLSRMLRMPELRLESATEDLRGSGERLAVFEVLADTYLGAVSVGRGWRLVVDQPSSESFARALELVRSEGGGRILGVILFRYPQPGEDLVLSLAQLEAVFDGRRQEPVVNLKTSRVKDGWELELSNGNESSSGLGAGSVQVQIQARGMEEVELGDFESVKCFSRGELSSPRLADHCTLYASYLARGATLRAKLKTAPNATVNASAKVR